MAVRIACALVLAGVLAGTSALAARWEGRWVRSDLGRGGQDNSVAVDPAGRAHILHLTWEGATAALAHTWWDGRRWRREIVDATDAGWESAAAIDASGAIYVAYRGRSGPGWVLKFARFADGAWSTGSVEPGGFSPAIALDSGGGAFVSHINDPDVRVARGDRQGWVTGSIGATGLYFGGTGIAVAPGGDLDVVFTQRRPPDTIVQAHRAGAVWTLSDVDVGRNSRLARDGAGYLHEVHIDDLTATTRYAVHDGQGWTVEVFLLLADPQDPMILHPDRAALAVDAARRPHVSLTAFGTVEGIGYGLKRYGTWLPTLLSTRNIGYETSIAVTPGGVPVVAARRPRGSAERSRLYVFRLLGTPSVSVRVKPARAGTVTSDPAGVSCDARCRTAFGPQMPVTLHATAADGWTFQGWAGACSGADAGCDLVTMDRPKRVIARFAR